MEEEEEEEEEPRDHRAKKVGGTKWNSPNSYKEKIESHF